MTESRKLEYDKTYMRMAEELAKLSYAKRNKVGCLIVSEDGQIVSQGYNGMPNGMDNCCEEKDYVWIPGEDCINSVGCINKQAITCKDCNKAIKSDSYILRTKQEVLHAESNAISKCAKWNSSTDNATVYVTLSPCVECSKLMIQSGIKRVVYKDLYRNIDGIDLLRRAGIKVDRLETNI